MNWLANDWQERKNLLQTAVDQAAQILDGLESRVVAQKPPLLEPEPLSEAGIGAKAALDRFNGRYASTLSGSAGPRYLGFVTGGTTPAGLIGDFLASTYDQNVVVESDSSAALLEFEVIEWLKQLFELSADFSGAFVSGATMSNFVGLTQARQWVGEQYGVDVAQAGVYGLPEIQILSGSSHSSIYKSLAMLGMGRKQLQLIDTLPGREAIDVTMLEPCFLTPTQYKGYLPFGPPSAIGKQPCRMLKSCGRN